MINKIILFGSTGMLGNYIKMYFEKHKTIQLVIVDSSEFRVIKESLTNTLIEDLLIKKGLDKNTCIINCIGVIPQRNISNVYGIQNYYIVNSIFPHILWNVCKKYGAKMIHPTTDCVFSGKKGSYTESDEHDESGHYGISKSLGEPADCTVIRCSIIGREKYNKKSFMEFVLNSTGEINGWDNHYWNGITCLEYCKIIEKIIKNNLFWSGCRHIHSPESISKYEIAIIIRDVFNVPIVINKVSTSELCDKTLSSNYNLSKILEINTLEQQILDLKHFETA